MDIYWFLFTILQVYVATVVSEQVTSTSSTTQVPWTDVTEEFSHYGTEFYLAMTNNQMGNRTLHIASNMSGVLRIEIPIININDNIDLAKGYTTYNISVTFPWSMNIYLKSSIAIAITVVDIDRGIGVFLALPVTFAGTSFMTAGSKGWYYGVAIMAVYDQTNVDLMDLDNNTESFTLYRLDIKQTRDYPDKTGTTVSASKPVTVNSGTTIHASGSGMSIEQMVPYEAWTDLYIVPPLPSKGQFSIRTLSMESQNICFKNKTSDTCAQITKATTNTTFVFGTDPVVVSSSSRVSVIQYGSVNDRFNREGDANMVVIPGIKNYMNTFIFAIPDITNTDHYLMCIVPSSEARVVLLDGSSESFDILGSVMTSFGNFSVLMKSVTPGYHEMKHPNPHVRFGALAYGFNGENSYAFSLGFAYTKRVNVGPWSAWTNCAVKYTGLQARTRFCENETKLPNGKICMGVEIEEQQCYTRTCPVNGNFNDWSVWSSCSHTCGPGQKVRRRYCNNPEPLHGGADCMGEATETKSCKEQSCPVVPYGYECDLEEDICNGSHTTCDEGRCRCLSDYYFDGDRCISKNDVCGEREHRLDDVIIIIGVVMCVIIVALAAYAVYVTVSLRRQTSDKAASSHQREDRNEAKKGFDSNISVTADMPDAKGTVVASTEQQYESFNCDLKDKSGTYDVIVSN